MSFAADVYAFAVLAWVVCTREQPYRNLQSPETVMKEMLMQATPTPSLEFYQPCLPLHLSLVARSSALTLTLPLPLSPPPATIPTPNPDRASVPSCLTAATGATRPPLAWPS